MRRYGMSILYNRVIFAMVVCLSDVNLVRRLGKRLNLLLKGGLEEEPYCESGARPMAGWLNVKILQQPLMNHRGLIFSLFFVF